MTNIGIITCNHCYLVLTVFLKVSAGINLMGFINHIPILKGDNYGEWIKKIDLAFVCGEVDKIIKEPKPTEPSAPVRGTDKTDADWQKKQKDCSLKDVI